MRRIAIVLALTFPFFNGCSITAHTPMTRFESPETRGESWKVEGHVAYQGRNEISLTDNYTFRSPSLSDPSVEGPGHRLMAQAATGVSEQIDISLSLPEARLGIKAQLMGDSRAKAAAGNFPVSVYAGIGANREKESGRGIFATSGSLDSLYELAETQADIGVVVGYRPTAAILVYGGPFMVWDHLTVTHRPTNSAVSTKTSKTARVYNANLGIQVNTEERIFFRLELAGARTQLGRADSTRATYGAAVGAYF